MEKTIKQITKILGDREGSQVSINLLPEEIWLNIYESSISIVIDKKERSCFLDCQTTNAHLTKDMVSELLEIMKVIEKNIDKFLFEF